MRIVFLLPFVVFSLSLPAQWFHRKPKDPPHHFYPAGTWLVVKERNDPFPGRIVADTLQKTYYRFGDSLNWNLEIITFGRHIIDRTIIRDWQFSDSAGNFCWLDPQYFSWYGYYCPYEGYGANWKITNTNDSEMIWSDIWSDGERSYTDSLWLKKIDAVNSPVMSAEMPLQGAWIGEGLTCGYSDSLCTFPTTYLRAMEVEVKDYEFRQLSQCRFYYSADTTCHQRHVLFNFHVENFEGRILLVSNDWKTVVWVDCINESCCWMAFSSDCDTGIVEGGCRFCRKE